MSFMDRIDAGASYNADEYLGFFVGSERLGRIARKALGQLNKFPDTLICTKDKISLSPKFKTYKSS